MGKRKRNEFGESLGKNMQVYYEYLDNLTELALSMFEWKNLPDTVDVRYLETCLFEKGQICFFKDDVVGFLALPFTVAGNFDVYGYPTKFRAYSGYNNYNKYLTKNNGVVCYNNYIKKPSIKTVKLYSKRLWNLDCAIDVNANAQKTPILLLCDDKQRLVIENLYKEYDGNAPVIKGIKGLEVDSIQVLTTGAPFVALNLQELKNDIYNECLTKLGISNVNVTKKERLITDEMTRSQGGTIASRYSRLDTRKEFCKKVNKMFDLNIDVEFKSDINPLIETESEDLQEDE